MTDEPGFTERLKAIEEKLAALDREEDLEGAVSLLEEAADLAESLGVHLEEEGK